MIQITIVSVGKRSPGWIQSGFNEYKKRLSHEIHLQLIELTPARRSKNSVEEKLKMEESLAILKAMPPLAYTIALDENGKKQTTVKLSAHLDKWINNGEHVCLIIGGADGLHPSVIATAKETWSLSDFTLPHALVRVILAEQLYRAWSLLKGHPYHRE